MHYPLKLSLGCFLSFSALSLPVLAHTIETNGEVAALFHIEPNHNPKAGQPSLAWFTLTLKGGQVIPLDQCNCKLEVHQEPHQEGSKPLLEPPLKAVKADQYQGIPGAEITFPQAGVYELELSGTPKPGASFKQPFSLNYEVTVLGSGSSDSPEAEHDHSTKKMPMSPSPTP